MYFELQTALILESTFLLHKNQESIITIKSFPVLSTCVKTKSINKLEMPIRVIKYSSLKSVTNGHIHLNLASLYKESTMRNFA